MLQSQLSQACQVVENATLMSPLHQSKTKWITTHTNSPAVDKEDSKDRELTTTTLVECTLYSRAIDVSGKTQPRSGPCAQHGASRVD